MPHVFSVFVNRVNGPKTLDVINIFGSLLQVMRKYKVAVEQLSNAQSTLSDQTLQISELEMVNASLKETITELNSKLETLEGEQVAQQVERRCHLKIKELEMRLDLEKTTQTRLQAQVGRLKEHLAKAQDDFKNMQVKEAQAVEKCRKIDRQMSQLKQEMLRVSQKENETTAKKTAVERQLASAEMEIATLKVSKSENKILWFTSLMEV